MLLRHLLLPVAGLYTAGQWIDKVRKSGRRYDSRLPVISVGNLSVGGTGKTPLTLYLIERLQRDSDLLVLSRGYGRRDRAERLWKAGDAPPDPDLVGDEPALMACALGRGALGVASDRAGLLRRIEGDFSRSVVLLDDGFQHYGLSRDLDLVIVDDGTVRAPWPIPAGVLREPPGALGRAGVILVTSDEAHRFATRWKSDGAEIIPMMQQSDGIRAWERDTPYEGAPAVAVCGIARPGRFLGSLKTLGASLVSQLIYSDHHRYDRADVQRILSVMKSSRADVVLTTAKDAVKLARFPELRERIVVAHLRVAIEGEERLLAKVREAITNKLELRNG